MLVGSLRHDLDLDEPARDRKAAHLERRAGRPDRVAAGGAVAPAATVRVELDGDARLLEALRTPSAS